MDTAKLGVTTSEPVAELRGATKRYPRRANPVLADITLTINQGQTLVVLGRSGSGKSTFLGLLAGLIAPTDGLVSLLGQDWATLSDRASAHLRAEHVGYIFQDFRLVPELSVIDNVVIRGVLAGGSVQELRRSARELLEALEIGEIENKLPAELSGGEQQRVAVARAALLQPALILADEPTGNLDSESGQRVMEMIRPLTALGSALVLATHEESWIAPSDRVLEIVDGTIRPGQRDPVAP